MSSKKKAKQSIKVKKVTTKGTPKEENNTEDGCSPELPLNEDEVFDLLWKEYCLPHRKSADFWIFKRPEHWCISHDLDFSFEFATLHDRDIAIDNPKNGVQLWSHFYKEMDRKALKDKYIPEVNEFFKRNRITKQGCVRSQFYTKLPSEVIKHNFEIPQINGKGSFLLAASDKIQGVKSDLKDYLVATEPINEGESLIIEVPLVLGVPLGCDCMDSMYFQCFLCRSPVTKPVSCPTCSVAIFCSQQCKQSCEPIHIWECKALRTHFIKSDELVFIALRMLLIGINSNFDVDDDYYSQIHNLPYNIDLFSETQRKLLIKKTLQVLIYLANQTNIFDWMEEKKLVSFVKGVNNKNIFLGGRFLQHLIQVISNVIYFPYEDYSFFFQTKGAIFSIPSICPTITKIRQDCEPNTQIIFKKNCCIVKAVRNIELGELITTNFYPTSELEVHNVKKKFLADRKMKCECRSCSQPYNRLCGEILLRCKICNAIAGKYNDEWKCFQCNTALNSYYMDCKKKAMEAKYMGLQRTKFNDINSMIEFLQEYPTIFCSVSREYIEVGLRCCRKMLHESKYVHLIQMVNEIFNFLNTNLHKYSLLKLHVIVKIVNFILAYHRIVDPTKKSAAILYECMKQIDELSLFHCLSKEFCMLFKLVWNIGFISLKATKEEVKKMQIWEDLFRHTGRPNETSVIFQDVDPEEEAEARKRQEDTFQDMNCIFAQFWTGVEWNLLEEDVVLE